MSDTVSPLAPQSFPQLPPLAGVALGTLAAGLRYQGRDDLFVAELAEGTSVAGVFTRSLCPSAPVDWCKQLLDSGSRTARAVVCNAGNANAFTGSAGETSVQVTVETLADQLGVLPEEIFV
ncbi:MAG: bifunctional ornithine acetyltransferase/N-acetylglutamate synthase, partial [Actinobacteria bacterium]|nr:bifunctional ornithine acetyltransferase/N-acetylglutamate synthase [Actinomycetota bacterium]